MSKPKNLTSWGHFPALKNTVFKFSSEQQLQTLIQQTNNPNTIAFGNGRSYGDSALSDHIIACKPHNHFLDFDKKQGLISCEAGVTLREILEVIIPKGWFLSVTPGTQFVTLGGAIAADVHGKNHHTAGCFSQYVRSIKILLADGSVVKCSKDQDSDLFHATCGGMGLTGIILSATIALTKIKSSLINQTTYKTNNLAETYKVFEQHQDSPYSVAWIDCFAKGQKIGRSLVGLGDFADDGPLVISRLKPKTMPKIFPSFMLNKLTIKLFNTFYYHRQRQPIACHTVAFEKFFYPLDGLRKWYRMYGRKGFIQYQFILPKANSYDGMHEILSIIANAGQGSFLAVLKLHGKANHNWLSFPMEGYSLALDFKIKPELWPLLSELDKAVINHHGRFYLAKDARVSRDVFAQGYPNIDKFRQYRKTHNMNQRFNSAQSTRIGL